MISLWIAKVLREVVLESQLYLVFAAAFVGDFLLYGLRGLRTPRVVWVMKLRIDLEKQDVQISNFQGCFLSLFFIFSVLSTLCCVCWSPRICIHVASTSNVAQQLFSPNFCLLVRFCVRWYLLAFSESPLDGSVSKRSGVKGSWPKRVLL